MLHSRVLFNVSWTPQFCVIAALFGLLLPNLADAEDINGNARPRISHVSALGVSTYRPGQWGVLNVAFVNPTDEQVDLLALTHFENEPTLQYGRRIWAPPKSRRQVEQPIRLPTALSGIRADFRTSLVDPNQSREVLLRSSGDLLQWDGVLRAVDESLLTGFIDSPSSSPTSLFDDSVENAGSAYELLVASQFAADRKSRTTILHEKYLPNGAESLNALHHLVIANNRVVDDPTGLEAVRRWLFGGGYLWIMLDRVDPRMLEELLGDEIVCEVVDRVGLTTVRVESSDRREKLVQEFESPVDFVRLAISGVDVTHQVDGWPAAFWKKVGEGRLLVTTLAPRGWMRLRTAADSGPNSRPPSSGQPSSQTEGSRPESVRSPIGKVSPKSAQELEAFVPQPSIPRFVVLESMATLATAFFLSPRTPLLPETVLEPLVQEYVGYSILPQWQAAGVLFGFCVVLVVAAVSLSRRRRSELLAATAPCFALAASAALVVLGSQQRQSVPPGVASMQLVQPISGTDDIRVEGAAGLFSSEVGTASISSKSGGRFIPEMSGMQGATRRMVWTDLDDWHWEHLPQTAGLRAATFETSANLHQPLTARAIFGPKGLTGRLTIGSDHRVTDPILATPLGRLRVELHESGTFVVRSENVFSAEQFLASEFVSDEQNRRRRLLHSLLTNPARLDFPAEPTLLIWTDPWDVGFHFDDQQRSIGAALVAVPLQFERPPSGTEVSIAAPFLPFRSVFGPDESIPSPMWDAQRRVWIERAFPSATWLRFQIPASLLPLTIQHAKLQVQVKGPVGKLEIAGFRTATGMIVPLKTWIDPVGTLTLQITDSEALELSADGGLLVRVSGGDPDRPELTQPTGSESSMSYWQIESLTLELNGKTVDVSE